MALMQPGTQQEGDRAAGARNLSGSIVVVEPAKTTDMRRVSEGATLGGRKLRRPMG